MKHFQIRLHGTGYDQYDVECPHGQVYDLVHFLCIDVCTVGTYQRPPPVSFCCSLEKLKKCLQENSDSRTDQCARCPKNCVKCSGPRLAQCQEFDDSARSRNRDDDEDCQTSSGSLLTTGSVFGLVLSLATLLVVLFNSGLIAKLTGIKYGSENVTSS